MNIKAEFFVAKQSDNEWSGVYGYRPDSEETFRQRGEMFIVSRIETAASNVNLDRISKLLLDQLEQYYFEKEIGDKSILVHLEESVVAMKSRMDTVLEREPEVMEKGLDIEMAICVSVGYSLYAGIIGESKIYLKREGTLVDISEHLVDAALSGFLKTGSLEIQEQDRLMLATSKAVEDGESFADNLLDTLDTEKSGENIKNRTGASILVLGDEQLEWPDTEQEQILEEKIIKDEAKNSVETLYNELDVDAKKELEEEDKEDMAAPGDNEEGEKFSSIREEEGAATQEKPDLKRKMKIGSFFSNIRNRLTETSKNLYQSDRSDSETESDSVQVTEDRGDEVVKKAKLANITKKATSGLKSASGRVTGHFKNNKRTYAEIVNRITGFFGKIISTIVEFIKTQIIGSGDRRDFYKRSSRVKRNRRLLLIAILVVSIVLFFGVREMQQASAEREKEEAAQSALAEMQSELNVISQEVISAKTEGTEKKQLVMDKLDILIESAELEQEKGLLEAAFEDVVLEANKQKDELLFIDRISQPQIIADISATYSDAELSDLIYTNGSLFISDRGRSAIYKTGINIGSTPEVLTSDVEEPFILVTDAAGDLIVYDNNSTSGIGKVIDGNIQRYAGLTPSEIGRPVEADVYSVNDALYELHRNHQQIYKRSKIGTEYVGGGALYNNVNPPNWKTDAVLAKAIDIAVVGDIYVLVEGTGLQRYYVGGANNLTRDRFVGILDSEYEALKNATALAVSEKYVALADSQNQSIYLFEIIPDDIESQNIEKNKLTLVKNYSYSGEENYFNSVEEIIIHEENKKLYVLDANEVLRIDLDI